MTFNDYTLVTVDREYDQANASNGESRFATYVDRKRNEFADWADPDTAATPEQFALAAWRVATGPIMSPGYVRIRPDLHGITGHLDGDSQLYFDIAVPLGHHELRNNSTLATWSDWDSERHTDSTFPNFYEPTTSRNAVLVTATVRISGKTWANLPKPVPANSDLPVLVTAADDAIALITSQLNNDAAPLVRELLNRSR
jgi:hypothetical protein